MGHGAILLVVEKNQKREFRWVFCIEADERTKRSTFNGLDVICTLGDHKPVC